MWCPGILHPTPGGLELLCSISGPLRAGHEAPFQAALSVSFTAACNISKGLIYCNSSGKQLVIASLEISSWT